MYRLKINGVQRTENSSLDALLVEAEQGIKDGGMLGPMELWQNEHYVAQLVWNGEKIEVHYTGD
jgi:hypothetical protein